MWICLMNRYVVHLIFICTKVFQTILLYLLCSNLHWFNIIPDGKFCLIKWVILRNMLKKFKIFKIFISLSQTVGSFGELYTGV